MNIFRSLWLLKRQQNVLWIELSNFELICKEQKSRQQDTLRIWDKCQLPASPPRCLVWIKTGLWPNALRVLLCYVRLEGRRWNVRLKFGGIRKGYGYPSQAQASTYALRFKERNLKKTIRPPEKQGDKHTYVHYILYIYVYILKYESRDRVD